MRKLSCVVAVIGPVLVITLLSAVTWQMYKFKELHFDMMSYALWILAIGLLVALYLVLTLVVLPKYGHPYVGSLRRDGCHFRPGAGGHRLVWPLHPAAHPSGVSDHPKPDWCAGGRQPGLRCTGKAGLCRDGINEYGRESL